MNGKRSFRGLLRYQHYANLSPIMRPESSSSPLSSFCPAPTHSTSYFLSFEGIEGAGKTTQVEKLQKYLHSLEKQVTLFREPGGTEFGEGLRKSILNCKVPLAPIAEAYLFASSRAQLLQQKILPLLKRPDQAVIVDRYYDSSVAYQGFGRELGAETIALIHQSSPLHYMPHLTFYLHIPFQVSFSRMTNRGQTKDYFESQEELFFQKMAQGFDWCAQNYPHRVVRIEGNQSVDLVYKDVINTFRERWGG